MYVEKYGGELIDDAGKVHRLIVYQQLTGQMIGQFYLEHDIEEGFSGKIYPGSDALYLSR